MLTTPPHVRSVVGRDGGVVLDIEQNLMFSLNVVGSKIWQKLQAALAPEQIAQDIADEFELGVEQARADVNAFIEDLRKHRLLTASQ